MIAATKLDTRYVGKHVMVLGAAGFIGRWVALKLSDAGVRAALVVRRASAARSVFKQYGVEGDIVEQDLRDSEGVRRLLRETRPVVVFNLAGYGVDPSEKSPDMARDINVRLVQDIARGIAETQAADAVIIHVGTAQEYGAARGNLEETTPAQPTTLYGRTKLAGTAALKQECQTLGLRGVTARLFTVYGPGEHDGRLLPSLCEAARTGSSLNLTAGQQQRDFTYVEDVADGLMRLGQSDVAHGEIVNLATGVLTPVKMFVTAATRALKIPQDVLHFGAVPTRADEMSHESVSVEQLRSRLAWVPPTTIEDGIRRTLDFYLSHQTTES